MNALEDYKINRYQAFEHILNAKIPTFRYYNFR